MKIEVAGSHTDGVRIQLFSTAQKSRVPVSVTEEEFSAGAGRLLYLRHEKVLCVGLGPEAGIDGQSLRSAAGTAIRFLQKIGVTRASLDVGEWVRHVRPVVEGALLAEYRFEKFKTARTPSLETLRLVCAPRDTASAKAAAREGGIAAEAANYARELGNQPGNLFYPATLAAEAKRLAARKGMRCKVYDEKMLREGGFGGLLAVGGGSARGPRLVVLEHRGDPSSKEFVALVGKAITFDSGGISLKPADRMEDMIFDKCGGMAVLGAMAGIAGLGLKRNVRGILASAENLPGPNAYRPGDIVKAYDGKNIEIINTDAEGRVVLADAIAYARKEKAAAIIDICTLTGAIGVALGEYAAGLWSTSEALKAGVLAASAAAGERLWPMPLYQEYSDQIKSDIGLLKNTGGRLGGSCTAAAFLQAFAGDTPWAHLDIAYMANIDKDRADLARGATGFGVRTLLSLIETWPPAP